MMQLSISTNILVRFDLLTSLDFCTKNDLQLNKIQ
jgi:hypothetical protein